MYKAYCAHCQGTERGTTENPRFSLKEDNYYGCPIVEVLKNGGQVTMSDAHFRFGVRKAQMLVACVSVLREFWRASDEQKLQFKTQIIPNETGDLRIKVYVEMHPDFELSDGRPIDRPWLRLQALPPDNDHIGLGTMKCRAICEVEEDLKSWLRRQGVPIRKEHRVEHSARSSVKPSLLTTTQNECRLSSEKTVLSATHQLKPV